MLYTNLLIFLTAIFIFSIDAVPEQPSVSGIESFMLLFGALGIFTYLARKLFNRSFARTAGGYFSTEKRLSILAVVFFTATLHLSDIKYYLDVVTFSGSLPVLLNISGLALFLVFLSLMWLSARKSYAVVFGNFYGSLEFLSSNIKANLPIVLPWVAISLIYDLIILLSIPGIENILESVWGDLLFFGFFVVFIMLFFPPLVRKLWGCRKLYDGPLRDHLVRFCEKQNFKAELLIWPLFEGRVLTAGVMGIVPGLRYILLTPAIIETMSIEELEAVMAHEIGHVKKKHLLLYVLLIGGFSVLAGFLAEPLLYYSFTMDWVFQLLTSDKISPETVIGLIGGVPLLILLLFYFRFVFGYFIRNFERQADIYVFQILGTSRALVSAFDKISGSSGHSKEKHNWHHFGIGERIEYLERCERDPNWIARQDRKVNSSLLIYIVLLLVVIGLVRQVPTDDLVREYEEKYIELVLLGQAQNVEDKALWYRMVGDLMFNRKMEQRALVAYNKALEIEPNNPETLNNLAWLLLTSEDQTLRNPLRALILAQKAVLKNPHPHVLDTLATAYWANGFVEDAILTEMEALKGATTQREFYRKQIERFKNERYDAGSSVIN